MKTWFIYAISYYDPEYTTKSVGVWANNDTEAINILKKRYGEDVAFTLVSVYGTYKRKDNIVPDEYLNDGMTLTDRIIANNMLYRLNIP